MEESLRTINIALCGATVNKFTTSLLHHVCNFRVGEKKNYLKIVTSRETLPYEPEERICHPSLPFFPAKLPPRRPPARAFRGPRARPDHHISPFSSR